IQGHPGAEPANTGEYTSPPRSLFGNGRAALIRQRSPPCLSNLTQIPSIIIGKIISANSVQRGGHSDIPMRNDTKNVFISHIHEDDDLLQNLKDLLTRNGYEIRDSSIDSSKPNEAQDEAYIKSEILAPRIRWAGTFIVLVSPKTKESKYVEWEIDYAQKQNKRIVGVWAQGAQGTVAPAYLALYADAV